MRFPKDFLWGGAIAANQAEGAYLMDKRSLSFMDVVPHKKSFGNLISFSSY